MTSPWRSIIQLAFISIAVALLLAQDPVRFEICHLCSKWDNAAVFLFLIVNDSVQYQFTCFFPCFVIVVRCLQMDMHYSTGLQYEQWTSRWLQEACVYVDRSPTQHMLL